MRKFKYPGFGIRRFKWSAGGADDFPKLSVIQDEIVAFRAPQGCRWMSMVLLVGACILKPEGEPVGYRVAAMMWCLMGGMRWRPRSISLNAVVAGCADDMILMRRLIASLVDEGPAGDAVCTTGVRCEFCRVDEESWV